LYRLHDDIALSDALPMMENLGLRVITEHPYRIEVDGTTVFIQDFEVESCVPGLDVERAGADFAEAFARTWRGEAENDGLNRLVLAASLDWRQVALLRGYARYLQPVGVPFAQGYVEDPSARNPLLARLLVELFEARFDPAGGRGKGGRKRVSDPGAARLAAHLEALAGGDEACKALLQPVVE